MTRKPGQGVVGNAQASFWTPTSPPTGAAPKIGTPLMAMGSAVLCVRGGLVGECLVATCKMFIALMLTSVLFFAADDGGLFVAMYSAIFPALLLAGFAWRLKRAPFLYFNRHTRRVYCMQGGRLRAGLWQAVRARSTVEADYKNRIACLALRFPAIEGDKRPLELRIVSSGGYNAQAPYAARVEEIWEYLRVFMERGPSGLPVPAEPNWWLGPELDIAMSPAEALRRYVPWRTGQPGEWQGKNGAVLPFWALMFPFNMTQALLWWAICKCFGIGPRVPPPEVMEGESEKIR